MPAVARIGGSPEAILRFQRFSISHTSRPPPAELLNFVSVQPGRPAGRARLNGGDAAILAPALVDVVGLAFGVRCPDHLWKRLSQRSKVNLRFLRDDEICSLNR